MVLGWLPSADSKSASVAFETDILLIFLRIQNEYHDKNWF
jgi:hypothetical protein